MIIRVGSNMTKNIVETKPENDVIANLLLYLHICEKVGFIYVPNSHQVRITYDNQNRLKKKRSYHEKRVQVANVTYRVGGGDGADVLRSKVQLDGNSQEERSSGLHCKFSGAYHICIDIFLSDFSNKISHISRRSGFTKNSSELHLQSRIRKAHTKNQGFI